MNAAATQDLRSTALTPTLSTLLRGGPRRARAPSACSSCSRRGARAARRGSTATGTARWTRAPRPRSWTRSTRACSTRCWAARSARSSPTSRRSRARKNGPRRGFTGGGINYIDKDLRQLLGTQFKHPFKTRFCGGGDLGACRTAVWNALDAAGQELETAQGNASPDAWRSDAAAERIKFAPGLLTTTIRYTNRPSGIQQVISFKGHRSRRR